MRTTNLFVTVLVVFFCAFTASNNAIAQTAPDDDTPPVYVLPPIQFSPVDFVATKFDVPFSLDGFDPGRYKLRTQNGRVGPYFLQQCNLITDPILFRQCQFDNLLERADWSFTRVKSTTGTINGKKIFLGKAIGGTTQYLEEPVDLLADNELLLTVNGFPTSFLTLDLVPYDPGNSTPTALFSLNKMSGVWPLTVTFYGKYSFDPDGEPLTYNWDFGDGATTSGTMQIAHTFGTTGTYPVTLTVADPSGATGQFQATVVVKDKRVKTGPTNKAPVIAMAVTNVDPNNLRRVKVSTVGSSDPDGIIAKTTIDFGDGTIVTAAEAEHVYQVNGTFLITVKVTDDESASASKVVSYEAKGAYELRPTNQVFSTSIYGSLATKNIVDFNLADYFTIQTAKPYLLRLTNFDGVVHPQVKCTTGTAAEKLACQFNNTTNRLNDKMFKLDYVNTFLNGKKVSAPGDLTRNKPYYEALVYLKGNDVLEFRYKGWPIAYTNIELWEVVEVLETNPPVISANQASGSITNDPNLVISIQDTSDTTTSVFINGSNVLPNLPDKTINVTLQPGNQSIQIISQDQYGNVAEPFYIDNLYLDTVAPTISVQSSPIVNLQTLPGYAPITVTSNEGLSDLSINGVEIDLGEDSQHVTYNLPVSTIGSQNLTIVGTDIAGNQTTIQSQIQVYSDFNAPVISVNLASNTYTNVPNFVVQIQDSSTVQVKIYRNNILELTTAQTTIPLQLNQGTQDIRIEAQDQFGNIAIPYLITNVILDTTAPSLSATLAQFTNMHLPGSLVVPVVSSEPLASLIVNDQTIDVSSGTTFQASIPVSSPGPLNLTIVAKDFAGNTKTIQASTILSADFDAPILTANVQGDTVVTNPSVTINVQDTSAFTAQVYQNSNLVQTTSTSPINVTLTEGLQTITITAQDAFGNVSLPFTIENIRLDDLVPQISINAPAKFFVNTLPSNVSISISGNKPFSQISLNGNVLPKTEALTIPASISAAAAGTLNIQVDAIDYSGRTISASKTAEVILENVPPVVSAVLADNLLTNQSQLVIPVAVTSPNLAHSKVTVNGQTAVTSDNASFNAVIGLPLEGINTIQISAVDDAGNTSNVITKTVTLDSVAPTLTTIVPASGDIHSIAFDVTGIASELLQAASANGMPLTVSGANFSGHYVSNKQGVNIVTYHLVDLAGNAADYQYSYNINSPILMPGLITVVPKTDKSGLAIVGTVGAARPGLTIQAATGFLNLSTGSSVVNDDGSFVIVMPFFDSALVSISDSRTGENGQTTVTYSGLTSISGLVKDTSGNPLPNVTVSFQGGNQQTVTDGAGNFRFDSPATGDQMLVFDGSTIPQSVTGPNRKFSKQSVAVNIGFKQQNVLPRAVYMAPLIMDGSETQVSGSQNTVVSNPSVPGVAISIPMNSATFPSGGSTGVINVATTPVEFATVPAPAGNAPAKIVSLEPSGLKFSQPVDITLPNDSNLPAGVEVAIFSLNSAAGVWEVDGAAKVSEDGTTIATKPGMGITHFSSVYAAPLSPVFEAVKPDDIEGIDVAQGSHEQEIVLPSFTVLGSPIKPALKYKSNWAKPTALVSAVFDIPRQTIGISQTTGTTSTSTQTALHIQVNCDLFGHCDDKDYHYLRTDDMNVTSSLTMWYQPDSVTSQFYVGSKSRDEATVRGAPSQPIEDVFAPGLPVPANPAISKRIILNPDVDATLALPSKFRMSYGVELRDPVNGDWYGSGVYPALARYQVKMREYTMTSTTVIATTSAHGIDFDLNLTNVQLGLKTSQGAKLLDQILPKDLNTTLLVQSKVNSSVGRGWMLEGVQEIINPQSNMLMVEEGDGSVSTYALNSAISTLLRNDSIKNYLLPNGQHDQVIEGGGCRRDDPWYFDTFVGGYNYDRAVAHLDLSMAADLSKWPKMAAGTQPMVAQLVNSVLPNGQTNFGVRSCLTSPIIDEPTRGRIFSTIDLTKPGTGQTANVNYGINTNDPMSDTTIGPVVKVQFTSPDLIAYCNANPTGIWTGQEANFVKRNAFGQMLTLPSGDTYFTDSNHHAVFRLRNGVTEKMAGKEIVLGALNSTTDINQQIQSIANSYGLIPRDPNVGFVPVSYGCDGIRNGVYDFKLSLPVSVSGFAGDNIQGVFSTSHNSVALNAPLGLAISPDGSKLVVADTGNNRIRQIDLSANTVTTIAGNGTNIDNLPDSNPLNAGIFHPRGLIFDGSGNLFISTEAGYILRLDTTGHLTRFAGGPLGVATFETEGDARTFALAKPFGMVFDVSRNTLYIADTDNHRVVQIQLDSMYASVVAGNGSCGAENDGPSALTASICSPTILGFDDGKNLLIQDSGHQTIRRVVLGFSQSGNLSFVPSRKDLSKIERNQDGTFTRTYRDGSTAAFNADGTQASRTDTVGRTTTFNYSSAKLASIVFPNAQQLRLNYSGGVLSSISDPAGRSTQFNISGGVLSSVTYPDSTNQSFQYDQDGLMTRFSDQNGKFQQFMYDQYNRASAIVDVDGAATTISDYKTRSANSTATPNTGVGTEDLNTAIVTAKGTTYNIVPDTRGLIKNIRDAAGRITSLSYDFDGNLTKVIRPDGSEIQQTYDPDNRDLLTTTDVTSGISTAKTYDSAGRVLTDTDGKGHITTSTYNSAGLVSTRSYPDGTLETNTYTSLGMLSSKTVKNSAGVELTTSYGYDSLGRRTSKTLPDGKAELYHYDLAGNLLQIDSSTQGTVTASTIYSYDSIGQLIQVTTPNGEATKYTYSPTGRLIKITDPNGKITVFAYDSKDRLISKTDPNGESWAFGYDADGNRTFETDPNGQTRTFEYDIVGQLSKINYADDAIIMSYDLLGRVETMQNSVSAVTNQYDSLSRIVSVTSQGLGSMSSLPTYQLSYVYDETGNRISATGPNGTQSQTYNTSGKLLTLNTSLAGTFSFGYDLDRLISVTRPGSLSSISYLGSGAISSIYHRSASSVLDFAEYSYDGRNLPTQKRAPSGTFNYSYDLDGQLTAADSVTGPEAFAYDAIGNKVNSNGNALQYDNASMRLVSDGNYTYGYDHNGNILWKNPLRANLNYQSFAYNSKNQLVRIQTMTMMSGPVIQQIDFVYDVLGRRIQRSIFNNADTSKSYTRRYQYDGDEAIAEMDANNDPLVYYIYSKLAADDVLGAFVTSAGVSAGLAPSSGAVYYLKDSIGSITDVVDNSGNVLQHLDYGAFGKVLKITNGAGTDLTTSPPFRLTFTYTGREAEPETDLMYFRARYYDPSIGRFLQQDPEPGRLMDPTTITNRYAYAHNSPFVFTDPSGKDFWRTVGQIFTAFVTVVVAIYCFPEVGIASAMAAAGATLAGSAAAGLAMAAVSSAMTGDWAHFWDRAASYTQTNFILSSVFLVGATGAAEWLGGGIANVGANGLFQGSVESNFEMFGHSGGLTLGSTTVFSGASPEEPLSDLSGFLGYHEYGHTLQFIGLSAAGGLAGANADPKDAWSPYLVFGMWGMTPAGSGWENSATYMGGK